MMLEDFFRRPSAVARYRLPPLGPLMDGFCEWLHAQGFSRDVALSANVSETLDTD